MSEKAKSQGAQCWICPQCHDDKHHRPGDVSCLKQQIQNLTLANRDLKHWFDDSREDAGKLRQQISDLEVALQLAMESDDVSKIEHRAQCLAPEGATHWYLRERRWYKVVGNKLHCWVGPGAWSYFGETDELSPYMIPCELLPRGGHPSNTSEEATPAPSKLDQWKLQLEKAIGLAAVFDDGGDGADDESARGVVSILTDLLNQTRNDDQGGQKGADAMINKGLQWYRDRDMMNDLPTEVMDIVVGDMVSIDVSTCDDDAGNRVFGKILEWQSPGPDGQSDRVWLCDLDQFNYDPCTGKPSDD